MTTLKRGGFGAGLLALSIWMLAGCIADAGDYGASSEALGTRPLCFGGECIPETTPIYAGKHIEIGTASVVSSDGDLVVTIGTTGGWTFDLVHVYAGLGPVPTNGGGNVAPGRFPYHYTYDDAMSGDELRIPLEELGAACGDTLRVAIHLEAHHDMYGGETAWAYGEPFTGRQWGWSFWYDICCDGGGACVQLPGFWRDTPDQWPPYVDKLGIGGVLYTKAELIAILGMDPSGDASIALAQEWIGMKLNWYCGVEIDAALWEDLLAAGSWFYRNKDADGRLPYGVDPTSPAGMEALAWAEIFAAFNSGDAGIAACTPDGDAGIY